MAKRATKMDQAAVAAPVVMVGHSPTQAEIVSARAELATRGRLADELPLDTPEWKHAVLVCGDIEGWIVAAREWGLVRRPFKDALARILDLREATA